MNLVSFGLSRRQQRFSFSFFLRGLTFITLTVLMATGCKKNDSAPTGCSFYNHCRIDKYYHAVVLLPGETLSTMVALPSPKVVLYGVEPMQHLRWRIV